MKRFTRMLALILTAAILMSSFPVSSVAATEVQNGQESVFEGYHYTLTENGEVSITGYTEETADEETDSLTNLQVPEQIDGAAVTVLAEEAFAYNADVDTVYIPASVTKLENSVFYHCDDLKAIAFAGETVQCEFTVAEGSKNLERLYVLNSCDIAAFCALLVNDLGEEGAAKVTVLEFDNLEALEEAFDAYISELESAALASAQVNAAADETQPEEVVDDGILGEGICGDALTWTVDADGVLTISGTGEMQDYNAGGAPWEAYKNSITSLVLSDGITKIGANAFNGYTALTGDLVIPDSVTQLGSHSFANCSGYKGTLKLSEALTKIPEHAFFNCNGFTGELMIPDSVTVIERNAFQAASNFTALTIGANVSVIGDAVFSIARYNPFFGCSGMKTVNFTGKTVPTTYGDMFDTMTALETVNVPAESFSAYAAYYTTLPANARMTVADCAEEFLIQNGVLAAYLGDGGDVVVPEGVTEIGPAAFRNCANLTSVQIPVGVASIGNYAFYNCSGLKEVTQADGLGSVGDYAFFGCKALGGKLQFTNAESIGAYAFYGCAALAGVSFGQGLKTIGSYAFYTCGGMTGSLALPDSVTGLGDYAFYGCAGLDGTLTLSEQLTTIPSHTFHGCSKLTGTVVIPDSVTVIGDCAFQNVSSTEEIVFGTGIQRIGNSSNASNFPFYGNTGVKRIVFAGQTVPTLASNLSTSMPNLETVYVPQSAYDTYVEALSDYVADTVTVTTDTFGFAVPNLRAEKVYSKSAVLCWDAHSSGSVVTYQIFRDNEKVGETAELSFTDRTLAVDQTYTYSVYGAAEDGSLTDAATLQVTTVAPSICEVKTAHPLNQLSEEHQKIYISVLNLGNLEPLGEASTTVTGYCQVGNVTYTLAQAQRSDSLSTSDRAVYVTQWNVSDFEDGAYDATFRITDVDGTVAEVQTQLIVNNTPPARIEELTATAEENAIVLNWAIAQETTTSAYRIYRRTAEEAEFSLLTVVEDRNTKTYTDEEILSDVRYYYYIAGLDDFEREGEASKTVDAILAFDDELPAVEELTPAEGKVLAGTAAFSLTATDNLGVVKTALYYSTDAETSWSPVAEEEGQTLSADFDTTGVADGEIWFRALAWDAAGNESQPLTQKYTVDNSGPEQVQWLTSASTGDSITLSWKDVADSDLGWYVVERKNAEGNYEVIFKKVQTCSIRVTGLTLETEYTYRVTGYDIHGNAGTPSEDLAVATTKDAEAPVIRIFSPTEGRYSSELPLSLTAQDANNIKSILLQFSVDSENWTDLYTQDYTDVQTERTLTYTAALDEFEEGYFFVRAQVTDDAGNCSEKTAEYVIDKTAPAAPDSVTAEGADGQITVSWKGKTLYDLGGYGLYRSEAEEGTYALLREGITDSTYIDRTAEADKTYYYKVVAVDLAGNCSELSAAASAQMQTDTQLPEVVSVYPEAGSGLSASRKLIRALVTDNAQLSRVWLEYSKDGSQYQTMQEITDIGDYNLIATAEVPVDEFAPGDGIYIRVMAEDTAGNVSEGATLAYTLDGTAPAVENAQAEYGNGKITVSWTGKQEADLTGYRIYRKTENEAYALVFQAAAAAEQSAYTYEDTELDLKAVTYQYKIEAVDACGNGAAVETKEVKLPDRSGPKAVITCETTLAAGTEYVFDGSFSTDGEGIVSYLFDFGDGTTGTSRKTAHTYSEAGQYSIQLTVTDTDGNQNTVTKTVTVKDAAQVGTVQIKVMGENGCLIPGASVYFDLGEETQTVKSTDASGIAVFTADTGKHAVGVLTEDGVWAPAQQELIVTAGETTEVTVTMELQPLFDVDLTSTPMTYEEMLAAGIDVTNPNNLYASKVILKLVYGEWVEDIELEVRDYEIRGWCPRTKIVDEPLEHPDMEIHVLPLGNADLALDLNPYKERDYVIVVVPIHVSCLKDFFSVDMFIKSATGNGTSLVENAIKLNVPDGLSIMKTVDSVGTGNVTVPEIQGGDMKHIQWVLRGDAEGSYRLDANYSGVLSPYGIPVSAKVRSEDTVDVYGMSDLKMLIEVPNALTGSTSSQLYYNISLINEGNDPVYRPKFYTEKEARADGGNDTLIDTRLYHAAELVGEWDFDYFDNPGSAYVGSTAITGDVHILQPDCKITKRYLQSVSGYHDDIMKLQSYGAQVQSSYGIEVEIVVRDVGYFTQTLENFDNAAEKADQIIEESQDALDYLLTDTNFAYWYYGSDEKGIPAKLTNTQQELFTAFFGYRDELFSSDEEQIQELLIDAMSLSVANDSYSLYENTVAYLIALHRELNDIQENLLPEHEAYTLWYPAIVKGVEELKENRRWEFYKKVKSGEPFAAEGIIGSAIVASGEWIDSIDPDAKTLNSILIKLLGDEGFEELWLSVFKVEYKIGVKYEGLLKEWSLLENPIDTHYQLSSWISSTLSDSAADISMYITAQSNIESYYKFLVPLICYTQELDTLLINDIDKVQGAAISLLNIISSDYHPVYWLARNAMTEAITILERKFLAHSNFLSMIKSALQSDDITGHWSTVITVLNSVYRVKERYKYADSMRYLAVISSALKLGISEAQADYAATGSTEAATTYLQLISYLIEVRSMGEVNVLSYVQEHHKANMYWNADRMLEFAGAVSGISKPVEKGWEYWRDTVLDRLAAVRVKLLREPASTEVTGTTAPVVTFNYAKGRTVQYFGPEYWYSTNGGTVWSYCDGLQIPVDQSNEIVELWVRRVDIDNTDEKYPGKVTIYPASSLNGKGITALQTDNGYRIDNLDPNKTYEVTFSQEPLTYSYSDDLEIAVPAGSYSYTMETEEEYSYVYIRTLADTKAYASYILELDARKQKTVSVSTEGSGSVTGAGTYEYGQKVTLTATAQSGYVFDGWYDGDTRLSSNEEYVLYAYRDRTLTARFTATQEKDWVLDDDTGRVKGMSEGTSAQDVIAYYQTADNTVTVTTADGEAATVVGTGYLLNIGDVCYTIVVRADVNGDAAIDIFDLFAMVSHINSETVLEGVYLEAACVLGNEDVDIFDVFAALEYINTGSFSE